MIAAFLTILLVIAPSQAVNQISDAQKKDFIQLLKTFPVKGEFYTNEAIDKSRALSTSPFCSNREGY